MFQRILVAIHNLDSSQAIFEAALSLANQTNSRLMLLHVLTSDWTSELVSELVSETLVSETSVPTAQVTPLPIQTVQGWKSRQDETLGKLRSLQKTAEQRGYGADIVQLTGEPSQQIYDYAQHWGADLILASQTYSPTLTGFRSPRNKWSTQAKARSNEVIVMVPFCSASEPEQTEIHTIPDRVPSYVSF